MSKDFLDARGVQEWLGISKPTLLAWLRDQDDPLPGVKIGGRWRFRRDAILEWWMRREKLQRADSGADERSSGSGASADPAAAHAEAPRQLDEPQSVSPSDEPDHLRSWLSVVSRMLTDDPRREES